MRYPGLLQFVDSPTATIAFPVVRDSLATHRHRTIHMIRRLVEPRVLCCLLTLVAAVVSVDLMGDEPEDSRPRMKKALAASSAGQHEKAIELATQVIAAVGDNSLARYQFATILEAAGRWGDAVENYTTAIGLRPQQAALYDRRGGAYFKLGEVEKSIADFDRAIELEPGREENHWRRGI